MSGSTIRVGLWGATGYTGYEIVRILLNHPAAEVVFLTAKIDGDTPISGIFPDLNARSDLICHAGGDPPELDVAFLAVPHRVSMGLVPSVSASAGKIIDLSADYRLKNEGMYEKWYGTAHGDAEGLQRAVYGLPELYRDVIAGADLIANPGCYATAAILAVSPAGALGARLQRVIVDAKTGISGGGRNPALGFHYPECNESVRPYKVGEHQHEPEIAQVVSDALGYEIEVLFVPHLVPMNRGIVNTCYLQFDGRVSEDDLYGIYEERYKDEPFVRVRRDIPSTKDVTGTNFCDIAIRVRNDTAIVISCIDNLIKGAAGQAVQNMNIMLRQPETSGLL